MLFVGGLAQAGNWPGPKVNGNTATDSSVFGAASSNTSTNVAINPIDGVGSIFGFHFSSSTNFVRMDVYDSSTTSMVGQGQLLTAFTVFPSTPPNTGDQTFVQFNPPLRFRLGLVTRANVCPANDGVADNDHCYTVLFDVAP